MKKYSKYLLFLTLAGLLIMGCTDDSPLVSDQDLIVVWAYLYGGEQLVKIKLTSTLPLDADTALAPPINDAAVALINAGQRYDFKPAPGDSGYYQYNGTDLILESGDDYEIEITYGDQFVTARTVIPEQPVAVAINSTRMEVPNFDDWSSLQEWRESGQQEIIVSWEAVDNAWFYVALKNIEENPVAFDFEFKGMGPVEYVFPPIADNQFEIRMPNITHLGRHKVTVYRVNQEYVDLYESRDQDSRDLNEPLTNIIGGLGVFTAFNSDNVLINVVEIN
ncbi:MAG: DUF4249 family protein [Candidatus Neomarinimicrobiota bacterium]